jgi:hypothetical protein
MEDPVMTVDGHTYERRAIAAWFALGRRTSPSTGANIGRTNLIPNFGMRKAIEEFLAVNSQYIREVQTREDQEVALRLQLALVEERLRVSRYTFKWKGYWAGWLSEALPWRNLCLHHQSGREGRPPGICPRRWRDTGAESEPG